MAKPTARAEVSVDARPATFGEMHSLADKLWPLLREQIPSDAETVQLPLSIRFPNVREERDGKSFLVIVMPSANGWIARGECAWRS